MAYKFLGTPGEYVPGVPATDLTDKEAKEYGVEDHPLYEKQQQAKKSQIGSDKNDE